MRTLIALMLFVVTGTSEAQPILLNCSGVIKTPGHPDETDVTATELDIDNNRIVVGDTPYEIINVSNTNISFGKASGLPLEHHRSYLYGNLDRVTGRLTAQWIINTGTYTCMPAKRLF